VQDMTEVLTKLGPLDGASVLVIRGPADHGQLDMLMSGLQAACQARGLTNDDVPLVVALPGDVTMAQLDDQEMAESGWVRNDGAGALLTQIAQEGCPDCNAGVQARAWLEGTDA
jgi:hypothetical protein